MADYSGSEEIIGASSVDSKKMTDNEKQRTVDLDFVANCIMHEEMKPFYLFNLFPSLKELSLYQEVPPLSSWSPRARWLCGFAKSSVSQDWPL